MQAFVFGTAAHCGSASKRASAPACASSCASSFVVATAGSLRTRAAVARSASKNSSGLEMKIRVAVVGGGPAGSCAAEVLAKAGIDVTIFERKMDNAKPCGGAIPLCMVGEFDLPENIIDRKVRKMKMISPSNREVDIGRTLKPDEYIGMCRREVLDGYLRDRAVSFGAKPINGLVTEVEIPKESTKPYTIHFSDYESSKTGNDNAKTMDFDIIIGADGANSRVAKAMDAGDYQFAIAFQERIKIPEDKMRYYEELAEMYVGDDVSPDFYAWVFPKYDHVAVGTGTVVDRPSIKKYQTAIRNRAAEKLAGGKILRIEAHPIPEHPRPRRVNGRMMLVGDAAGYVTKCSGEGIYFAAKSGRMCAESLLKITNNGEKNPTEQEIKDSYIKDWDRKYWATYKVLDVLQSVFYTNNVAREAFVELCDDEYVQKVTFDSYLYKEVTKGSPVDDIKLLFRTAGAFLRGNAFAPVDVNKF
ncbi:Geranylgeranyl diphosphate reductase [Porphyridium purpureum]|uniref:Geranylgeranyl diphosphate reductase, chloroplastic n=1 Tax=Porphyridium purpureum TaxID=35688 RepID=A0A5J4YN41_PORPP|nr:Geranylgeranyl diphosphate reductase [Porphyridium purpureum]|eukprot:POR5254..scf222_8